MVSRPIQHEAQPSAVWVSRPQPARVPISHVLNFKPTLCDFSRASLPLQDAHALKRSILAIPHASHNKGNKGTGGAFDLPTQVTIILKVVRSNSNAEYSFTCVPGISRLGKSPTSYS